MVERVWFLNTEVSFLVAREEEAYGISVLEHHAAFGDSPPLHSHRRQDETFHVISGQLKVSIDGRESLAGPGQTARLPKGIAHSYRVVSRDGARFLTITGGGEFEAFVRKLGRQPTGPGLPPASAPPTQEEIEALVRLGADYGIDIIGPPLS